VTSAVRRRAAIVVAVSALSGTVAGCGGPPSAQASAPTGITPSSFTDTYAVMTRFRALAAAGRGAVGVLLPDDGPLDPDAALQAASIEKALRSAGLDPSQYRVDDAHGSAAAQRSQAAADMATGASVLLLDPVNSTVGATIEEGAGRRGVRVVDYDRFTQGGTRQYFVGFDSAAVGTLLGDGAASCVSAWHLTHPQVLVLNRPLSDPSAVQLAQGISAALATRYQSGAYVQAGVSTVAYGPSAAADLHQAEQLLPGLLHGVNVVVAADDPLADAVVAVLEASGVGPETVAVTGPGASLSALRAVLSGYRCGSVDEPAYAEAQAGAAVALYLRGEVSPPPSLASQVVTDTTDNYNVPAVVLTAHWVTAHTLKQTVVADHEVDVKALCAGDTAAACRRAGIGSSAAG